MEDERTIAGFVQLWLYFGMLSEVVGWRGPLALLQRHTNSSETFLSSRWLEVFLVFLTHRLSRRGILKDYDSFLAWLTPRHNDLRRASEVVQSLCYAKVKEPGSVLARVCLGIAALGTHIERAILIILCSKRWPKPSLDYLSFYSNTVWKPILDVMQAVNWCPSTIFALSDIRFARFKEAFWFFANLTPPPVHDNHQSCTSDQCASLQVDESQYQSKHVTESCLCEHCGPTINALRKIVLDDAFPLVKLFTDASTNEASLVVEEQGYRGKFVAISHVWADGLGNARTNSLPRCALLKVQRHVNALVSCGSGANTPFWMDTLCLPVQPKILRKKALSMLNEPFAKATKVLVIDGYLQNFSITEMSPIEALARITISGWFKRLWTLAEGSLAQSTWFQFKDQALEIRSIAQLWSQQQKYRLQLSGADSVFQSILLEIQTTFNDFREDRMPLNVERLLGLQAILVQRTTSRAYDEPLCIAAILGLDVRKLVNSPSSDRMQAFWSILSWAPAVYLFQVHQRRLTAKGFRWAPASLMTPSPVDAYLMSPGQRCADGLIASLPTITFKASQDLGLDEARTYFIRTCQDMNPTANRFAFWLRDWSGHWFECEAGRYASALWHQDSITIDPQTHQPAILLERPIDFGERIRRYYRGLLVWYAFSFSRQKTMFGNAYMHIVLQYASEVKQRLLTELYRCGEEFFAFRPTPLADLQREKDVPFVELCNFISTRYARRNILLQNSEADRREGGRDSDYQTCLFDCVVDIFLMWRIGRWCVVDVHEEPISWCID